MVGRASPTGRRAPAGPHGWHFLSSGLAAEFVRRAHIEPNDVVFEIGAGTGRLTRELSRRAGLVIAVETDPRLAERLRHRFAPAGNISIVEGDALVVPLPEGPFRALGNVPFGITTALLRRLLQDPTSSLARADLIVQWEAARKRASPRPGNLLSLSLAPWWRMTAERRIPARFFHPRPSVDGGLLVIRRRSPPLLPVSDREAYEALLQQAFRLAGQRLQRSLGGISGRRFGRLAREFEFGPGARAMDLDVAQWVGLFRALGGDV